MEMVNHSKKEMERANHSKNDSEMNDYTNPRQSSMNKNEKERVLMVIEVKEPYILQLEMTQDDKEETNSEVMSSNYLVLD